MRKSWSFLGTGLVFVALACGGSSRSDERDGAAKGGSGAQPNGRGTIDHALRSARRLCEFLESVLHRTRRSDPTRSTVSPAGEIHQGFTTARSENAGPLRS
jgi:hypothetical protein